MEEQQRFQPYNGRRRPYRSWLQSSAPVPPRTTADRYRRSYNEEPIRPNPLIEINEGLAVLANSDDDSSSLHNEDQARSNSPISYSDPDNGNSLSGDESFQTSRSSSSSKNVEFPEVSEDEDLDSNHGPAKDNNLENKLYPNAGCTKFETLLLILSFSFRHCLSQLATEELCKLFNRTLGGEYIPTSKHMFRKIFGNAAYNFHFYCKNCLSYIESRSNGQNRTGSANCEVCEEVCHFSEMNGGHFFITFPLKDQLQFLLENTEDVMHLLEYRWSRNIEQGVIGDIYDGKVYSDLAQEGNFLSNHLNLSMTFSVDGAQVFDAVKNTLWPIVFYINEFPPNIRFDFNNSMLGGLWFGKTEPSMPLFLHTFAKEVNELYQNGFSWVLPNGNKLKSKCILLNCIADSKAKPMVQSIKCHSGYYGCGYCEHPGVMFEGSSQAKYPLNEDLVLLDDFSYNYTVNAIDPVTKIDRRFEVKDRENVSIRRDMEIAERQRNARGEGDVKGVKGKSVLWCIPFFDLVFGFVVDYMHSVLLGVVKHTTGLWLNSCNNGEFYYIGLRIREIDARLLKIKPPLCISRRPRSLSEMCHWKANEWRSWLLYYSLPCLVDILPTRYLQHHCLLVSAIHLLLQDKISRQDLTDATEYLGAYCVQFMTLYSRPLFFFNIHLLLHLGKCVDMWGPLFCFSSFSCESTYGRLVKLVQGTRGVLSQIAEKYTKCKMIPRLLKMYSVSENTIKFCDDLMCFRSSQIVHKLNDVTVIGSSKWIPFQVGEQQAFELSGHDTTNSSYQRLIIRNVIYHARCYNRRGVKSDSSVIKLKSGSYAVIERIIDPAYFRGPGVAKILLLVRLINTSRERLISHPVGAKAAHITSCSLIVFGSLALVTTDDVSGIAILLDCSSRTYVADFPNTYEKD